MQTLLTAANQQTLLAQISTLDFQISKLLDLFNAPHYKGGSLMLSGHSSRGKDFNELIVWRNDVPLPKQRLKEFLQAYAQDLIVQRFALLALIESPETAFKEETRPGKCPTCCKETLWRNYYIVTGPGNEGIYVPTAAENWICNDCESIIREVQP